jgi:hypothetical protein
VGWRYPFLGCAARRGGFEEKSRTGIGGRQSLIQAAPLVMLVERMTVEALLSLVPEPKSKEEAVRWAYILRTLSEELARRRRRRH